MTSNPRFAQYVDRVQENLAAFSLSDKQAEDSLIKGGSVEQSDSKFVVFEILVNDNTERDSRLIRKFEPHVSSKLSEGFTPRSSARAIERLDANTEYLDFQWNSIDWSTKELAQGEFANLDNEIDGLFALHKEMQGEHHHSGRSLDELEREISAANVDEYQSELNDATITLKQLIKIYEREKLPTNLAASALIYEAWNLGRLQALSSSSNKNECNFESLLDALFVHIKENSNEDPLIKMAQNIGASHLSMPGKSCLKNGAKWIKRPEELWISCVENALIHALILESTPSDTYIIHFPLIIDEYRFVGFCYLIARIKNKDDLADIFTRSKYVKFFRLIQSVSETLRLSLRDDALDNVTKCLNNGEKNLDRIFLRVVKDYFVCFDVVQDDGLVVNAERKNSLNTETLYCDHSIKIYGPEWISKKHKRLLCEELDGRGDQSLAYAVPGLYQEVKNRIEQFQRDRSQAKADQAGIFSHQAAGLVAEVWCDPHMGDLRLQSQGCLWQLKTLIDLWGNFDLEEDILLDEGPQDFPADWISVTGEKLLGYLIDTAITHALRRATYRRSGEDHILNEESRRKAFDIKRNANRVKAFKDWVGLDIVKTDPYPEWVNYRGFVICFHHCFWQSAFHGFRASCGSEYASNKCFVRVEVTNAAVIVSNRKIPDTSETYSSSPTTRDAEFYTENLHGRLEKFKIDGPKPISPDTWQATISYPYSS
ncbi:MAG: hypothetical protein AAF572_14435 [Cyanobacteria bacterium P01_B01_bin.77]